MKKINLRLLALLEKRIGGWCHPEEILKELKVSRKKLLKDIEVLKERGFTLHENPHFGYELNGEYIPLVSDIIQDGLETRIIGRKIEVFGRLASTMDLAREIAEGGPCRNGCVVFAEEQSRGRGRLGRTWISRKGRDLLFSVALFPAEDIVPSLITICASLAVADCLCEKAALKARVRFPNDVVVADRKIAGVLVEKARQGLYILGVGINVNETEPPLPEATSLRMEKGKPFDRNILARQVLSRLDEWYSRILETKLDEIDSSLRRFSSLLGKSATVMQGGKKFSGTVVDISAIEGLTLRTSGGETLTFKAEQITLTH